MRFETTIPNTQEVIDKFIRKQTSKNIKLRCVYEAGPTSFGLCRYLRGNGIDCIVVAPCLIPKKDGDRIKKIDVMPVILPDCIVRVNWRKDS